MAMQFNASSSLCYNPDSTALDYEQTTFMCAFYATGVGQGGAGVVMVVDDNINAWHILTLSGPAIEFRWKRSGTNGRWRTNISLNRWYWFAITYDRTGSADPTFYIRDLSTTNALASTSAGSPLDGTPSGTATTPTLGWAIGNLSGGTACFDGYISNVRIYNRILTLGELDTEFRRPGTITNGLSLFIDDRGADRSGSGRGATTVTNVTVVNGNGPGVFTGFNTPLWIPYSAAAASGAISGTSDGVASVTGALIGLGALSGTAAGIGAATGAALAIAFASGTSDGVGTVAGSLTGLGALAGTSDGLAATTALLTGLGALAGLSEGSATVTGNMINEFMSGLAEGLATVTGTLTGLGALSGLSDGLASVQGLLSALGALAGTSDGLATVTGLVNGLAALSGTSDGVATVAAVLNGLGALSGSSEGQATVTGVLLSEFISGLAAGLATVTGTLTATGALAGTSDGVASTLGALTAIAALSGQISAVANADGTLVGLGSLAGLVAGAGSVSGALTAIGALTGSADGLATATGYLNYEGEIIQIIANVTFANKPFGIAYFIPKTLGSAKFSSY